MKRLTLSFSTATITAITVISAVPLTALAASTSWPTVISNGLVAPVLGTQMTCSNPAPGTGWCDPDSVSLKIKEMWVPSTYLSNNISVSVSRYATIINTTNGQSGDAPAIKVGDSITFSPQQSGTDIVWNGTGGAMDTPYGVWGSGGSIPCDATTQVSYNTAGGGNYTAQYWGYAQPYIIPGTPVLDTSGSTASLSCTGLTCSVTSPGTIQARLTWPATTGAFNAAYTKTGQLNYSADNLPNANCGQTGGMIDNTNTSSWLLVGTFYGSTDNPIPPPPHPSPYVINVPSQSVSFTVNVVGVRIQFSLVDFLKKLFTSAPSFIG